MFTQNTLLDLILSDKEAREWEESAQSLFVPATSASLPANIECAIVSYKSRGGSGEPRYKLVHTVFYAEHQGAPDL